MPKICFKTYFKPVVSLHSLPFGRDTQVKFLCLEVDYIRQQTLVEAGFVFRHEDRHTAAQRCQVARVMVGREEYEHLMPSGLGNLNSRNHVAVGRHDNGHIAVVLVCVAHYLGRYPHVSLFLLIGVDYVAALETRDLLSQVFSQNQPELGILLVRLEKRILSLVLSRLRRPGREIFHGQQFLVRLHEFLEQSDKIKPIEALPLGFTLQTIEEVETVNIYYNSLFLHVLKNSHPLKEVASLSLFHLRGIISLLQNYNQIVTIQSKITEKSQNML